MTLAKYNTNKAVHASFHTSDKIFIMQIYVFFVVCGFVAHLTGADIAYEKYNDRDPKNDPFADTDWQPLPDSETELKMLVKDMQQLVRVTFDRYNNQKGDIHDDFMQMLASYATCKPQEGHPAPMIPNKTLYENNPLMQQYEIPRRLFRMAMEGWNLVWTSRLSRRRCWLRCPNALKVLCAH
ncbi:Hypothetical predicted protein [Cloeon dipterum]|uniref:Uncharacterized protein n=1 Tax=Cloeon dipterum TaxID=197152 RepID=A0A8S1DVI0_9INSE|nr:Hypothetical predicted protein [Cloeon dipterum]